MSVETAVDVAATDAPETEAEETVVAKTEDKAVIEAIQNWDADKAGAEDAPVGPKLLNQVVPLYKQLNEIAAQYNAATDVDEAVKNYTFPADSDEAKLAKQIEQARALIAKNEAKLAEAARAAVLADVAPDFDELKVKSAYRDTRTALRGKLTSIREAFEMLGFVESDISPAGRRTNYRGTNEHGKILVELFEYPSIEGASKSGGAVDEEAKAERKAAKAWGKANGYDVADKGQISKELLNAYRESLKGESK